MLIALLLALQAVDSLSVLTVRDGERRASVPVVVTTSGPLVRASQALPTLGVTLNRPESARAVLTAGTTRIELTMGLPFARVGVETIPLGSAPAERDGEFLLPLSLLIEVLPRVAPEYAWDPSQAELRRLSVAPVAAPGAAERRTEPRVPIVVVDAGHGGPDRGMRGPLGARAANQIHEADITLAVSKRLRDALEQRGVRVIMTRMTDTLIALYDRGRIANESGADLFLSIHVNAANPRWRNARGARGVETFFLAEARSEDERRVAEMENEAARFEVDAPPDDPLRFLVTDMLSNEYLRESSELAATIQGALAPIHPGGNRGVKQAGFVVLITALMPAVLVELGFGTNPTEMRWLASTRGQQVLANAIADATMKYLAAYERRRHGSGRP